MPNEKIQIVRSTAVPLPLENVDTDQIIPARFLKATTKVGFGDNLFRDWRYDEGGNEKPDFVLNKPLYRGSILVAGKNFGCGSSREHAAWAIKDYGFKVVVSSFFADIFRNNALNNGVLPLVVSDVILDQVLDSIVDDPSLEVVVDLPNQLFSVPSLHIKESFEISTYKKECLINGLDDIEYLISMKQDIEEFEQNLSL